MLSLRLGYANALGAAFALVLVWRGLAAVELPAGSERQDFAVPHSTPRLIVSALPADAADTPVLAVLAQAAFTSPRYVLDHIATAPASYELASIHF